MSDEGPSWWCTRVCSELKTSGEQKVWFLLLEFFQKNSNKYALLHISASDGDIAQDATFSHDEIFSRYGYGHSFEANHQLSRAFRSVLDHSEPGAVTAQQVNEMVHITVHGESMMSDVRLVMKNHVNRKAFVDRTMKYMTYVEACLEAAKNETADCARNQKALLQVVKEAANAKKHDDNVLHQGLRILMKEKSKYWLKR